MWTDQLHPATLNDGEDSLHPVELGKGAVNADIGHAQAPIPGISVPGNRDLTRHAAAIFPGRFPKFRKPNDAHRLFTGRVVGRDLPNASLTEGRYDLAASLVQHDIWFHPNCTRDIGDRADLSSLQVGNSSMQ
jgi:hypothetical protein